MRLYCGQLAGLAPRQKEKMGVVAAIRIKLTMARISPAPETKNPTSHMLQRDKKRMRRMESDGRPGGSAPAGSSMPAENPYVTK